MVKKIEIILFFVGATLVVAYCLIGVVAFADTRTQDGQPCPPECVSDSMEIETYYPSPYGYYEELRGDKIIVGDTDNSYIDETHLPPSGTITFEPKSYAEITNTGTSYESAIYYDKIDHKFKYYDKDSRWQDLGGGGVPSGAVMSFNLSSCPAGWSELTAAQGRYVVARPSGGTLGATVGTALSNQENRPVGQHNHTVNDPGHTHLVPLWHTFAQFQGTANGWEVGGSTNEGYMYPNNATTGITVNNAGTVAGTNAPYIQLLLCQKD